MSRKCRPLDERFWSQVNKSDGCWLWTGATDKDTYGVITIRPPKRLVKAHRLSWALTHGPVADGLMVLHHCDTPRCVRPDHLFLGTHLDNKRDEILKGRQVSGSAHHSAKLTEQQIPEIRRLCRLGVSKVEIAKRFGVRSYTIYSIAQGSTWKGVPL